MARKILLADDSVTAQNMGRKILADAGYDVITVNNGSAALKKIAELKPELIILDVYMPGYSGLEVCQRLKDAHETARIPVLLSVGKLEPFKPDEAKRVRAEGYIVKPFEASELLSALSKLEDKIVPKAEAGKPGRLGRAVAIDESTRSGDEPAAEGSWKSRISFPSKKKEQAEESSDDGALYNAVNRDLKTVVQRSEPETPIAPIEKTEKTNEERVDLGALAATGLPKDVTTEEIAALAAAAAHVQGRKLEAESAAQAGQPEVKAEETTVSPEPVQEVAKAPVVQEISTTQPTTAAQTTTPVTPTEAEVSAAIASLETEHAPEQVSNVNSGNGAEQTSQEPEDLPVTMAASPAFADTDGPRWTAVSVAVEAQEAAVSLEQEMQSAFRAFSAAAAAQAGPATLVDETQASAIAPVAPETVVESMPPVVAAIEAKTEPVATAPAEVSAEALGKEVFSTENAEFAVARGQEVADHSEQQDYSVTQQAQPSETTPAHVNDLTSETVKSELPAPTPIEINSAPEAPPHETSQEQVVGIENAPAIAASEVSSAETIPSQPTSVEAGVADVAYANAAEVEHPAVVAEASTSETAAVTISVPQDSVSIESVPVESAPQMAVSQQGDVAQQAVPQSNESDVAATTAAAWASWRQIRDSVPALKTQERAEDTKEEPTQDSVAAAAFAAAAGAETSPSVSSGSAETTPGVNSQTVASIVDSLLAELRPKIVEEISRKLAVEKK